MKRGIVTALMIFICFLLQCTVFRALAHLVSGWDFGGARVSRKARGINRSMPIDVAVLVLPTSLYRRTKFEGI